MEEIYGIIYKVTNLINGKIYIGQTTNPFEKRKWEHLNRAKLNWQQLLYKAIRKYGEDNFNWCIIDFAYNEDELDDKEKFWIKYYKTYIGEESCNGYNMTIGGESNKGAKLSEETRRKQSEARKGEKNPMYGKTLSEEAKKRLREYFSGENSPVAKSVIQLTLNGKFVKKYPTVTEGAKSVNGDLSTIISCCRGKKLSASNYIWMYEEDYCPENVEKRVKALIDSKMNFNKNKRRKVVQLTISGDFVATYPSVGDAEISIAGKRTGGIGRCCAGNAKTYKGYRWMYEEDYLAMKEV